jgi:hypothetical protein
LPEPSAGIFCSRQHHFPSNGRCFSYFSNFPQIKTMTQSKLRSWVKKEMFPYNPCHSALIAANHYEDAQTAWEAWEMPDDMLYALVKTQARSDKLTLCVCELASVTLPIIEAQTDEGKIFKTALAVAQQWACHPNIVILQLATDQIPEVKAAVNRILVPISARYAAAAVYKVIRTISHPRQSCELSFGIECAILSARIPTIDGLPLPDQLLRGIDNDLLTEKTIKRWQCDCIRKHFPKHPAPPEMMKRNDIPVE